MLFLQAGLVNEHLWLWGEVPLVEDAESGTATTEPTLSPYSPSYARLREVLTEVGVTTTLPGLIAYLDLPTAEGRPIPSSPLLQGPPSKKSPTLKRWAVGALPMTPDETLDLLARCVGRETLQRGVGVGVTLAYWTNALRYAGALVAREQVLPRVRKDGDRHVAHWQPVFGGQEPARFDALVNAMPPACRGLLADPTDALTAGPTLLRNFLNRSVDAVIRQIPKRTPAKAVTAHDAWLQALANADATIEGKPAELTALTEQVTAWQRPVLALLDAPFRLCFRLEEPGSPADPWKVSYLLQARDDPSLLLPAEKGWQPGPRETTQFRQRNFNPREYLLTALGQAATLCPEIETSLKQASPGAFSTDGAGAHAFLTNSAMQLEQSGFGVMLPAWWTGSRPKLTLRAAVKTPKMQAAGGLTLDVLLNVDWQAALGDEKLSPTELLALAALKSPLVLLRGQWVEVRPDEIQKLLDQWQKKREKASLGEIVRMALGAGDRDGFEVSGVDATGWLKELLAQMQDQAGYSEVAPSPNLQAQLRPYQLRGASWLLFLRRWRLGACLADDMGLGKTLQTLATILHDVEAGETRPVLLVCPTSVLGNWQREAARFTPTLPVMLHHGTARAKKAAFAQAIAGQAIVLTSYALLHRDTAQFAAVEWAGIVLDEAQNIKNPETKQAKAARSLPAGYRVLLTGTPVENHVGDLWSLFEFLNQGLLGGQTAFRKRYFLPIQTGRDPTAAERLKRVTGPFILRRLKTDKSVIADLPDKVEMKVFCPLTREQASLYQAVVKAVEKTIAESEGIQRRGLILSLLTRLKQICNHPAHYLGDHSSLPGRSGKLNRLTDLTEEILESGERGLIFTQYTEMGEMLKTYLQETFGREVLFLHGGVPRKQRDAFVARFQGEGGPPLFVLSLKAGGTGLNLTSASHVVHFDRWWNPAVENQATDRAFRIGQTRKVLVHKFTCTGTLEERIDAMIDSKASIASNVVGTGERWLTEMTNKDLRDLLKLSPEAVED